MSVWRFLINRKIYQDIQLDHPNKDGRVMNGLLE